MPERVLPEEPLHFLARHGEKPTVLDAFVSPLAVKVVEITKLNFVRGAGRDGADRGNEASGKWWFRMDALDKILTKVQGLPEFLNERRNLLIPLP
jgi:hypothetical protein